MPIIVCKKFPKIFFKYFASNEFFLDFYEMHTINDCIYLSHQEDEWREFEEEERNVDFTGLKIQNVQLNDDEFYSGSDADGGDGDGEDGDGEKGAWKKMQAAGSSATDAKVNSQAESDSSKKKPGLSATSTGVYVSPALRQQQPLMAMRLKKDALPDINNEEYFPTLGDAKKEELRKKKNEPAFEEVKQGARFQRSSDLATNAPVSIGNRYNSLADSQKYIISNQFFFFVL